MSPNSWQWFKQFVWVDKYNKLLQLTDIYIGIIIFLLGILKYYTLQMEGSVIYQAPQASNLVLFSPIWLRWLILSSVLRRNCSASFLATHVTRPFLIFLYFLFHKEMSSGADYSFPTMNPTQRLSSQHDFISNQVNDIFQRVCRHLPTSGELQFWGLRTQSRYFFSGMATTLQSFIMIRSSC